MPLQIRKLKFSDIFPMSKIIKKIGIKEIMRQATASVDKNGSTAGTTADKQMEAGIAMLAVVLENIHLAEEEVTEFLANLVGLEPKAFADLPFDQLASIYDQLRKMPGLADFLQRASQ